MNATTGVRPCAAEDLRFIARALQLAKRGLYSTRPNPRVGCVLVHDGEIVGEGWHEFAGGPHAEIAALGAAGAAARGATCYVTLEPCCYHGRTPPCTEALIAAGVRRVVTAVEDPNPRVAGGGNTLLRAAGMAVETGVLAAAAGELNAGFIKRMRTGLPWVRVKVGMSLDGRIAAADGGSRWITSAAARRDVQRLRGRSCAVLTGIGTVLADDPLLTVREPEIAARLREQPLRVVVDSSLRFPCHAQMLSAPGRTLIVTSAPAADGAGALRSERAEVIALDGEAGRPDLRAVLVMLGGREINEVLVEAGPVLTGALIGAGLVDEIVCYVAPKLLGADARGVAVLPGVAGLADAVELEITDLRVCGADLRITARPGK